MMIGVSALAASCRGKQTTEKLVSGINPEYLDTTVSPADDFYRYACGGWMAANPLTDEYARFGTFDKLREDNREQIKGIIEEVSTKENAKGSIEQKIGDLYNLGMDSTAIEALGADPLAEDLNRVNGIKNLNELTVVLAESASEGSSLLFRLFGNADPDNSKQCIAWVWQSGLGIGDRDYYLESNFATQRQEYVKYLTSLLQISGYNKIAAIEGKEEAVAKEVLAFETKLAQVFMEKNKIRDPFITKNVMSYDDFKKLLPAINIDEYTKILGLNLDKVNVGQVDYIKSLNAILQKSDLGTIKHYLATRTISGAAPFLSKAFVDANFDFYSKTMSGIKEQRPRWKRITSAVESYLGQPLGQMYVKKYFPEESKKRMIHLVDNLKAAYRERIAANKWMQDSTKQKSYEKLDAFIVKIGYPDKWRDFSGLDIDPQKSYYANVVAASKFEVAYRLSKIGKPVDNTEWGMNPQTVNAYYRPTTNEICFPAGILQPPFFNAKADDAVNYGAIGVVIGHEMSHGFDDKGRNYDKDGNLVNWWSPADDENFKKQTQVLVDWFNGIEVIKGTFANGRFTLGENIADNGGVNIAFDAMQKAIKEGSVDAADMDGYSAAQRFFIAYAQIWASNVRDEEIIRLTKEDVHSLGRWRVNATLPHINAFATTYKLNEGDKMFLAPEKRASIW